MGSKKVFRADGNLRGTGGTGGFAAIEPLLTEHEAAAQLGLSVKTLRRWRWCRRGPAWIKLCGNGAIRYQTADLDTFIEAGRVQPIAGKAA